MNAPWKSELKLKGLNNYDNILFFVGLLIAQCRVHTVLVMLLTRWRETTECNLTMTVQIVNTHNLNKPRALAR